MSTHTYHSIAPRPLSEARKAELCVWFIRIEMAAYYGVLGAAALSIGFLASLH